MTFLCPHCGNVWLHIDESIRYHRSGKCIPLDEKNNQHDFRKCPRSAFNLRKGSKMRARVYQIHEIKKIDDHALLTEVSDKVRHWNSRLANYELELHVKKKHPLEGEKSER